MRGCDDQWCLSLCVYMSVCIVDLVTVDSHLNGSDSRESSTENYKNFNRISFLLGGGIAISAFAKF